MRWPQRAKRWQAERERDFIWFTVVRYFFVDKTHLTFEHWAELPFFCHARARMHSALFSSPILSYSIVKVFRTLVQHNRCTESTVSYEIQRERERDRCQGVEWSKGIYWFNLKIERRSLVLFHIDIFFRKIEKMFISTSTHTRRSLRSWSSWISSTSLHVLLRSMMGKKRDAQDLVFHLIYNHKRLVFDDF